MRVTDRPAQAAPNVEVMRGAGAGSADAVDAGPIFVVGAGRSGTTLLRTLLSAHSRIAVAPETHFVKFARAWSAGELAEAPEDFEVFWRRYLSTGRFADLGVDAEACRRLMDARGDATFRGIFAALLRAYAKRERTPRVGEKTPGHVFFLDVLFRWFPRARVIMTCRDPRAVIASQLKTPWNAARLRPVSFSEGVFVRKRSHEVALRAGNWARIYEDVLPAVAGDPRVMKLRYEALVARPEHELKRVCIHVGEPFEPAMLADRSGVRGPSDERRDVPRTWRALHHARTQAPVTDASLDKWKHELSRAEVRMIESRCARGMRAGRYDMKTSPAARLAGRIAAKSWLAAGRAEEAARSAVRKCAP